MRRNSKDLEQNAQGKKKQPIILLNIQKNKVEYNRKIIENAQRQKSTDAGKEKLTMKYNRSKIHAT